MVRPDMGRSSAVDVERGTRRHPLGRRLLDRAGWAASNPGVRLRLRRTPPDRDRALSHAKIEQMLTDEKIPLRERLFWRLAYETAARSSELLALDVPDLDLPNRSARVTRKAGARDTIVWQTATARLIPRYLRGRTEGRCS